jgi:hypothetical protein
MVAFVGVRTRSVWRFESRLDSGRANRLGTLVANFDGKLCIFALAWR